MSAPRPEEVQRIVHGLMDALESYVDGATADELVSASFTLTLLLIEGAVRCGADPEVLRQPLETLYRALPPNKVDA